jgi:hypothetical protein
MTSRTVVSEKVEELFDIRDELKEENERLKGKREREKKLRAEILEIMKADGAPDIKGDGFKIERKTTKPKVKIDPSFLKTCIGEFCDKRALSTENQTDLQGFLDYVESAQKEKGEEKESLTIRTTASSDAKPARKRKRDDASTASATTSAPAQPSKKRKGAF